VSDVRNFLVWRPICLLAYWLYVELQITLRAKYFIPPPIEISNRDEGEGFKNKPENFKKCRSC
jgi:hypothetical protein